MSQSISNLTNNQAFITTDTSKIFLRDKRFEQGTFDYTNSTYDDVTIAAGTVLGRIASTNKLVVLTSAASDGSQFPVGILAQDVTVEAGDSYSDTVNMCVAGDVAQEKLVFQGSDTLATVVSSRTLKDRIGADTVGVKLVTCTELTEYDNL
jgi:hypothetical protein